MNDFKEILENVSLKDYNTYKIGGNAKYLVKPSSVDSLVKLIQYLKTNDIKFIILGNGSNIILPDEDYDGCVIILSNLNKININNTSVNVESGISLNSFINKIVDGNLGGLENLYGIPGTLGGAIVGNAGCNGSSISDYIDSVTFLEDNNIKTIDKSECNFKYRNSIFKNDKSKIILSANFELYNKNKDDMLKIIKENHLKRINSQPLEYPNAGSVFKNPEGLYAGKLINDLGLKGYHINDAYISDKHANFIINKGNATCQDILRLIEYIKTRVKEEYKIDLELEQEIIKY